MQIKHKDLYELAKPDGGKYFVENLETAYSFCNSIAKGHYENFPVASIFIPKKYQDFIYSIYAFARIADDIADECDGNPEIRINALDNLNNFLSDKNIVSENSGNPIFIALRHTIKEKAIPITVFQKLITAFKRDILFKQADDFEDLLDYCTYSANPVGELVLRVFDEYNETSIKYSDSLCTGLQLVNFWQDFTRDLQKNRIFIPKNILKKHKISNQDLFDKNNLNNVSQCLNELYNETENIFNNGKYLLKSLKNNRLRLEIKATYLGGKKILNLLRKLDINVLYYRPYLSKIDYFSILLNAFFI